MRSLFIFLAILSCALFSTPSVSQAEGYDVESEYRTLLIELIKTLQAQIISLQTELEDRQNINSENKIELIFEKNSIGVTKTYKINDVSDVKRIGNSVHRKYFQRMFDLFPSEFDLKIKELAIFSEEDVEFDAFVETLPPEHDSWLYGISEEMFEYTDSDANTELVIHELAHIVGYEEITGLAKPASQTCNSYFKQYGCPSKNSYLAQFVSNFWSEDELSRAKDFARSNNISTLAYEYYLTSETQYVSDYAVVSPEEDFAETFMFFVLGLEVRDGVVQDKINFMNSFPELRSIQSDILENK